MKLIQTLDNGLKIKIESLFDWARLDLIISDAKKPNIKLAKKLSSKMAIEGDYLSTEKSNSHAQRTQTVGNSISPVKMQATGMVQQTKQG